MKGIRNVVLLSHQGAGKTSLAESMLFTSGATQRLGKVQDGTTTSDYDLLEIERHIGINLSLLPLEWKETKVNLIDTPGYIDPAATGIAALLHTAALVTCQQALGGTREVHRRIHCQSSDSVHDYLLIQRPGFGRVHR